MLESALMYAKMGWHVFPIHGIKKDGECTCGKLMCKDIGKHPKTQRGYKDATTEEEKIKAWFSTTSETNIGIATGSVSGITVIDIDVGPDKDGFETWQNLIREHGEPQTLVSETGGGGMHFIFSYNSGLKTSNNTLGKNVDCRNDGGYIVAPPSTHYSGRQYKWMNPGASLCALPAHLCVKKETRGRPKKDENSKKRYTIEQVSEMLDLISSDDRTLWRNVGVILGREFNRVDEAWMLYNKWANTYTGKKDSKHNERMHEAFYVISQEPSDKELTIATIVKIAIKEGWVPKNGVVPIENFLFFGPGNNYIYRPTGSLWIAAAVDSVVDPVNVNGAIKNASEWLRLHRHVTSMTSEPSLDSDYVVGFDCLNGEIIEVTGAALFNKYIKPRIVLGSAEKATPFVDHCKLLFNKEGDCDQFLDYMAHRAQKPEEKPRFALLISGEQGTGKDTAIEFCTPSLGIWNVANIEPCHLDTSYNSFVASTLVRISEAANLQDMSKWAFNERTKVLIAGSPDYCVVNPKYGSQFHVRMHCGVIITTNHLSSSIHIPPDDRRYDVIEVATKIEMGLEDYEKRKKYFSDLWDWFLDGGAEHVADFLHKRDLSKFSASNGQRKTLAHQIVIASGFSGDDWLHEIIEEFPSHTGIRTDWLMQRAVAKGQRESDVRRTFTHALGRLGYVHYPNLFTDKGEKNKDGRWLIGKKRVNVYVKVGTPRTYDPRTELNIEVF